MKQLSVTVTILFCSFISVYCQTNTNTGNAQQKILQLEKNLIKAIIAGDSVIIDKSYANDYTGYFGGRYENKKILMENIEPLPNTTITDTDMVARVYGNAAVVNGVWEVKMQDNKTFYRQYTDMLINDREGWKIVASQQSSVPAWMVRNLADSEFVPALIQGCETESSIKSMNSDVPTYLRFKNNTPNSIIVYWINYSGERDKSPYQRQSVAAGKDVSLQTFMTHPFVVTGANGKCYGIYMATQNPSIAIIKD